jgi:hypothetical protein
MVEVPCPPTAFVHFKLFVLDKMDGAPPGSMPCPAAAFSLFLFVYIDNIDNIKKFAQKS